MTSREDSTFVTLIQCSSSVTSNSRNDCSTCFPSTSPATWTSGGSASRSSRCDAISEPGTSEFDSEEKLRKKTMQVWRFENLRTAASSFWLSHRWSRWKSTASPGVNKSSHLNLSMNQSFRFQGIRSDAESNTDGPDKASTRNPNTI